MVYYAVEDVCHLQGGLKVPGRLVAFIITLLIIFTFIFLNHNNSSDIQIWFGDKGHLTDVPIYLSFFIMYLIGVLSVIPFSVGLWLKQSEKKKQKKKKDEEAAREAREKTPDEVIEKKKRKRLLGGKKKDKKSPPESMPAGSPENDGKKVLK